MPWLRVDDAYDTHPKLLELPEIGRWRWTRGLLYCARYRTNGVLTSGAIADVQLDRFLPTLLDVGLLAESDGSYAVHDWLLYNGGTVEQRVAIYLDRHPEATANDVARAVVGSRNEVLAAVRKYRLNGTEGGA